jgi:hypothetical protein
LVKRDGRGGLGHQVTTAEAKDRTRFRLCIDGIDHNDFVAVGDDVHQVSTGCPAIDQLDIRRQVQFSHGLDHADSDSFVPQENVPDSQN